MLLHNLPHFEWPWALAALLLLPLLAWRQRRLTPPTLVFNRTAALPPSARQTRKARSQTEAEGLQIAFA